MTRTTRRRLRVVIPTLAALTLVLAPSLLAHDFWLVPNAFSVAPGEALEVRGQTSSRFPTSEAAVDPDRVADARLLGARDDERITDFSTAGNSLLLRHRPHQPGQRVVAVSLHPRSVRESAEGFRRYVVLEGAPEALERYERAGLLPAEDSITRRYAKYAKAIVEVEEGGPRAYDRRAGYPLEFVPLEDPSMLAPGAHLPVRVLYRGEPLPGARVHAGSVVGDEEPVEAHHESDASGVIHVGIDRAGLWNVRGIHIVPADAGSGADWDTHWASLVFEVNGAGTAGGAGGHQEADSAAVAAVLERFHGALATGDSTSALSLLAPDALIVEGGGVETRAEYRGHHLPADIAFARAVDRTHGPIRVRVEGDAAWAVTTSTSEGTYRGREIDSAGAELAVLRRTSDGWKITAIHWSSRARSR